MPFCTRRCGYCAFNTYAPSELSADERETFVDAAIAELRQASAALTNRTPSPGSIYFGGGTPTILTPGEIGAIITAAGEEFDLASDIEITVEANPDGIDDDYLAALGGLGVDRVSFGMQSTSPRVLRMLDRSHNPERALEAVAEARAAGITHVNLDLIYGTPGELPADFEQSLRDAINSGVDHVSAYALGIESGTKLAARVRSGLLPTPSSDEAADRYEMADDLLSSAGFEWYEISNWAQTQAARSRHNLTYWRNQNWWGVGPGAHSHLSGVRWWNLKQPKAWSNALLGGPGGAKWVDGLEVLSDIERRTERIMLELRTSDGLAVSSASVDALALNEIVADGLVRQLQGRLVLTRAGRLLADQVALRLI